MRYVLLSLLSLSLCGPAWAQDVLIKNGRYYTMERRTPTQGGDLLLSGGRIAGFGRTIRVKEGTEVVDASGKWVTPGIINAFTRLGLEEVSAVSATRDESASSAPFSAALDVAYGVNGAGTPIAANRIGGITRAATYPRATQSLFAGFGAVIDLSTSQNPVFLRRAFAYAEMGERGAQLAGGSRGAAYVMLTEALAEASGGVASDAFDNILGRVDATALRDVVRGRVPLFVHVERAGDIVKLIGVRRQYSNLKLVFVGVNEGWMVADALAASGIPVIVNSAYNLPNSFEMLGATLANAARLKAAGVKIAIASGPSRDETHNTRLLLQLTGNAVAYGLPWHDGLAAITSSAADVLSLGDQLGTLTPGKLGDVVIWDGDPLEITSQPEAVFINGRRMPMVTRQTKLRDRYLNLEDDKPFAYRH